MRTCAAGLLLDNGRVLLGKRSSDRKLYPDLWDAIGGHAVQGESPAQALCRELHEEIGITPTEFRELGVLEELRPGTHGQAQYHIFVVTRWHGAEPTRRNAEHSEIRWVAIDEALGLELAHPGYIAMLRALKSHL